MRFRPILMTSFAFVAGLVLVMASGAGAVVAITIGGSAMGEHETLLGVLLFRGCITYLLPWRDGRGLIKGETQEPYF
jgi:hypothetical protein